MRSLIKNGDGGGSGEEGSSNTTTTMRSHSASGTTNDNIKDAVLPLRNIKKKQSSGWLTAIVSSIFEPGINDALLFLMHGSFICLIVSLFWMLYLTRANNAHVLICTIIAISLYGVLIWFIKEVRATLSQQKELVKADSINANNTHGMRHPHRTHKNKNNINEHHQQID